MDQYDTASAGARMYDVAKRLFPIGRSLTGNGVRETLRILGTHIPLEVHEVPTGIQAFDWRVPKEWNIRNAYIITPAGERIAEYAKNNLHLVGYSTPVNTSLSLTELQSHLYSLPEQPGAIPYITSYYAERWGFCLSHAEREKLAEGTYHVVIDSELTEGSLTYAECILPGTSSKEILLSTYVCHPSMANNELSGPVVAMEIVRWLQSISRKYTYRVVFIPETLGSIVYVSRHLRHLQEQVLAGFVLTCEGDDRSYSFIASREGNTLADRVARRALRTRHPGFRDESYLWRGSDERTYCSPRVNLPVVSMMRTRYGKYPEYHTSLDDLSVISPQGLRGSFDLHRAVIEELEREPLYQSTTFGEPQLSKRGLYSTLSRQGSVEWDTYHLLNVLTYADGTRLPQDIAEVTMLPIEQVRSVLGVLLKQGLVEERL